MPAHKLQDFDYDFDYDYDDEQPVREPKKKYQRRMIRHERPNLNRGLRREALILVMVMSVMAMLITARSSIIASRGYETHKIRQAAVELESRNAELRIANAKLRSPQRIKDMAAKSFGMSVPENVYFAQDQEPAKKQ